MPPDPGAHLIQTVHLLRGVHDLAAPGAVGIHGSGKGWGGDARARARSLSPERAGGRRPRVQLLSERRRRLELGTGLRLRPPSPNKHSGEEGLHRGGDAPRPRAGARTGSALPGRRGAARGRIPGRAAGPGARA